MEDIIKDTDKFSQLVKDLKDGKLGLNHLQIAYRTYLREREDLPEGIKDLLCGGKNAGGLIGKHFQLISELVGNMELAYLRGSD